MFTRRDFNTFITGSLATTAFSSLPNMAIAASSSLERVKTSGVLRIGAVPDGAPYYQRSITDSTWRGFYIDICQKLADDLGLKMEILDTTWGNSVLDLQSNKIDVFFGLNRTPERAKVIEFSGPVFNNAFSLVAKESVTGETWADLNTEQMRLAVDAGSSHDSIVTKNLPNAQISRLKNQSDATAALQAGRVDAQCLMVVLALALKAKNPKIGKIIIPKEVESSASNAGFRREDDRSWQNFVMEWIEQNRATGFVRDAIIRNMGLMGVTEADFPPGFDV